MSFGDARLDPDFIGKPLAAVPGCYSCGNHKQAADPGVVDTGLSVHMEGRVFLCIPCIEHLANVAGLLDRATADRLREKNVELADTNRRLGVELRSAKLTLTAQQTLLAEYSPKK